MSRQQKENKQTKRNLVKLGQSFGRFESIIITIFFKCNGIRWRLDSNIESKSLKNTYLNKHHRIAKFGSNIDFEKRVILSVLENLYQ